jgi:lipopolysaccharide heptosyltransferase II
MLKRISPSELPNQDFRRICIIKPSALGDVVQALPLLPVLRQQYPRARISWVINRELSDLLVGHPHLDDRLLYDRRGTWRDWRRLLGELRRGQFDLTIDLQGLLRSAVMSLASRAPVRVGLQTAREGARHAANCIIPDSGWMVPAHSLYWRVAETLKLGEMKRQTLIHVGRDDRDWAERQFAGLSRPVLAVHPGARWDTKRWPVEKFALVACKAMRVYGFSVVIVGASAEIETGRNLERLLRRFVPSKTVLNLTGRTTLKKLAAVLNASDVLLTSDSGPMHLAAGLGTPVLGVFTCTSPQRSGPPGRQHELVATEVACAASYRKRCPHSGKLHMACMEELPTQRVCRALVRLMEKNRIAARAA